MLRDEIATFLECISISQGADEMVSFCFGGFYFSPMLYSPKALMEVNYA